MTLFSLSECLTWRREGSDWSLTQLPSIQGCSGQSLLWFYVNNRVF
jgi:hypothetical protein